MKKALAVLLALLVVFCFMGCSKEEESASSGTGTSSAESGSGDITRIAFVSYQALDSSEWLQNLVTGLNQFQEENPNVEIRCMEALTVDQYEPRVRACAEAGYDIIITTYADMSNATVAVAEDYPDIKFGILQGEMPDIADYPNIQDFHLNRTESAFVQGAAAALMTKTGTVGFIGGSDSGGINEILAGYQQGIQYINNGTQDLVAYTNSFTDPTIGHDYALQMIADGADVIFGACGGSSTGCAQAAEESGIMYAACDVHYPDVAPNAEIGSAMNYFENMVISFIKDCLAGNYQGGTSSEYGMSDGAVAYEFADNGLVPDDIKARVNEIAEMVKNGEFDISTEPLHK